MTLCSRAYFYFNECTIHMSWVHCIAQLLSDGYETTDSMHKTLKSLQSSYNSSMWWKYLLLITCLFCTLMALLTFQRQPFTTPEKAWCPSAQIMTIGCANSVSMITTPTFAKDICHPSTQGVSIVSYRGEYNPAPKTLATRERGSAAE